MVSSDLGACEWFVWDLRRSGLIDRGQLDQVIDDFLKRNPRSEPPALAEFLIQQGILSPFQADRILQGKTQGLVLGPYVLVDAIGSGSMGQVYKATSKTDNQWYAIKVLPRRSMWNVRLARRQVRSFSQFSHAAVVPFVDVGTSGGLHYLVWPLVEGETLEARVQREGKLAPEVAAEVAFQVAQGLTVCHQNGIFHGLLKPSNIMLGLDGQARLLDFGIGSLLVENEGESLVDTMSTANTLTSGLDCASPESIMEPTNRTPAGDQYSLGCVLYYCLAGRYPFPDGTAVEKMMAHQFKPPTPLRDLVPGLPEGLVNVVERLMQKSPDARFNGTDEVVEALRPFTASGVSGQVFSAGRPVARPGSRPDSQRVQAGARPLPSTPTAPSTAHAPAAAIRTTPAPQPRPAIPPAGSNPPLGSSSRLARPTLPSMPVPTRAAVPGSAPAPTAGRGAAGTAAPSRPVLPTRNALQTQAAIDVPQAIVVGATGNATADLPEAQPMSQNAPGWVAEEPKSVSGGLLLLVALAGAVAGAVFLLGKNFFGN